MYYIKIYLYYIYYIIYIIWKYTIINIYIYIKPAITMLFSVENAGGPSFCHHCSDEGQQRCAQNTPIILQSQDQSFFCGPILNPSRKVFLLTGSWASCRKASSFYGFPSYSPPIRRTWKCPWGIALSKWKFAWFSWYWISQQIWHSFPPPACVCKGRAGDTTKLLHFCRLCC